MRLKLWKPVLIRLRVLFAWCDNSRSLVVIIILLEVLTLRMLCVNLKSSLGLIEHVLLR